MDKKKIYIKETKKHGKSIFANQKFKRGETVFIVCGPIVKRGTIYTVPISKEIWIDPVNNSTQYLCQSYDLNCGIKNRTEIVAIKKINKEEEINIDYAMIVSKYGKEMNKKRIICKCGSKNCRGKLGSYKELPKKLKAKYKILYRII